MRYSEILLTPLNLTRSIQLCLPVDIPGRVSVLHEHGDEPGEVRAVVVEVVLHMHPLHEDVGDEGVFGSTGQIRAQHLALETLGWSHQ